MAGCAAKLAAVTNHRHAVVARAIGQQAPAELRSDPLLDADRQAEARRHDHQGQDRRQCQPPDHGDAHRRAPRSVAAQRQGGGHHARDHRYRRHDDRLGTLVACVGDRGHRVDALAHLLQREIDQQDRVLRDDAEQHQDADKYGH